MQWKESMERLGIGFYRDMQGLFLSIREDHTTPGTYRIDGESQNGTIHAGPLSEKAVALVLGELNVFPSGWRNRAI